MILIFPLPPTDNRLRVTAFRQSRLINSSSYRNWLNGATIKWNSRYKDIVTPLKPSFENQIKIPYKLYFKDKRSDISNYEKATKDFLSKRLYDDDKWVKLDLQLPVEIDKINPRIEIII